MWAFAIYPLVLFMFCVPAVAEVRGEFNSKAVLSESGLSQLEQNLTPSFSLSGDKFRFYSEYRLRIETIDELEPEQFTETSSSDLSKRMNINDYLEFEVREFFIDGYIDDFFLKLGKQQVVWGQSDGLRVLDVVNPLNYREFILTEFDERRIPLWTLSIETSIGQWQLQTVWVPDQTYDNLPDLRTGATFAFTSPLYVPSTPANQIVNLAEPKASGKIIKDSDVGFRLSTFTNDGWDIGIVYFYHFRDNPVLSRSISNFDVTIEQAYKRSHLIGISASNALGDFILRSEVGYSTNVHYLTDWANSSVDYRVSPQLAGVLGIDYQGISNVFLSGQVFANHITSFPDDIVRKQTEIQYTLRYEQTFENETWTATIQNIQSINRGDGLLQFSINHQYSSVLILTFGADAFYGNNEGLFGQFKSEDRVHFSLNYSF
ncbi:DUF1302 family protein [Colwellia sp. E150_009]